MLRFLFGTGSGMALFAAALGVLITVVWVIVDFDYLWPTYVSELAVYVWAGLAAYLSWRFPRVGGWLLIAGLVPLLLWTVTLVFGVGDPTPLVPFALYSWATVRHFRQASAVTRESPNSA